VRTTHPFNILCYLFKVILYFIQLLIIIKNTYFLYKFASNIKENVLLIDFCAHDRITQLVTYVIINLLQTFIKITHKHYSKQDYHEGTFLDF